ncbi:MAG: hypothetical protein WBG36_17045 [Ornithinimicrobium sp.]
MVDKSDEADEAGGAEHDGAEHDGEEEAEALVTAAGPGRRRLKRQSRRAQRPATDGVPEHQRVGNGDDAVPTALDDAEEKVPRGAGQDPTERWWREQRPPHWE